MLLKALILIISLYRLVNRGIFNKESLPWKGKCKPNGKTDKRCKLAFRRDIRERSIVYPEFDSEFGHLKGDTNYKSAVITLVEKQSKVIITLRTKERKAGDIEQALTRWLSRFPKHFFKSMTFDCGKEFSNWKTISNQHDIDIFFADPDCPG